MEGQGDRVLRSCHRTRRDKDGRGKGKGSFGLADTKVCQGCVKVLRIGELLLTIYQRLCIHSEAFTQYGEEEP